MKITIDQLFEQVHNIPQIPEVVKTLIAQLNNPDIPFHEIAANVEKEQMISLKVLRLVNSAHFGLSKKINSIDDAVVLLGMSRLKTLVIASGIVSAVPDIPNFDIKQFWLGSFNTANYAKWVADESNLEDSEMAFTAGLICGLGKILIQLGDPKAANEIEQHVKAGHLRPKYEINRLGFTNLDVCKELCKRWKFAPELTDAVYQSGDPLEFEEISPVSCAVAIGRYISEHMNSADEIEEHLPLFPKQEWKQLGLAEQDIAAKLPEILAIESGLEGLLD